MGNGKGLLAEVRALAVFELCRRARSRITLLAGLLFAIVLALGHWVARGPDAGGDPDRMFGYAYLLAALLTLRLGLAVDRESDFDEFLTANFISPVGYLTGKIVALAAFLLAFALYTFTIAIAMSLGDFRYAAWYTLLFTLMVWVFSPLVALVELGMTTRVPAMVVAIALVASMMVLAGLGKNPEIVVQAFGLNVKRYEYGTLWPLVARSAFAVPAAYAALYALLRRRLCGRWR